MYALFYEKGMFGEDFVLRVGTEDEIRHQLAYRNDWLCLVQNGRIMGPKKDQPELNKLHSFLMLEVDRNTMEALKIKLSTGALGCVMCAESNEEIEKMRAFLIKNMKLNEIECAKINTLIDQISKSLEDEELYTELYEKISRRQYINTGISCDSF